MPTIKLKDESLVHVKAFKAYCEDAHSQMNALRKQMNALQKGVDEKDKLTRDTIEKIEGVPLCEVNAVYVKEHNFAMAKVCSCRLAEGETCGQITEPKKEGTLH